VTPRWALQRLCFESLPVGRLGRTSAVNHYWHCISLLILDSIRRQASCNYGRGARHYLNGKVGRMACPLFTMSRYDTISTASPLKCILKDVLNGKQNIYLTKTMLRKCYSLWLDNVSRSPFLTADAQLRLVQVHANTAEICTTTQPRH
jgi:hypothetical protein